MTEPTLVISSLERQLREAVTGRTRDSHEHAKQEAFLQSQIEEKDAAIELLQREGRRVFQLAEALQKEVDELKVIHARIRKLGKFLLHCGVTVSPEEELLDLNPAKFVPSFRKVRVDDRFERFYNRALELVLFEDWK